MFDIVGELRDNNKNIGDQQRSKYLASFTFGLQC